ncbi:DUF5372 family protein [Bradyrhizobium sp. RDM12]
MILYPFHPRAGQMVQVEHRKRFAGEDHLVVVQPDGTLALIPAWMSEDIARSATLTASPRLAVERLVELRAQIDVLIASRGGARPLREGGDHATKTLLATKPVRGGSPDARDSGVAEKHSRPPDREAAGRGPRRRRQYRDGHANRRDEEAAHEQGHA